MSLVSEADFLGYFGPRGNSGWDCAPELARGPVALLCINNCLQLPQEAAIPGSRARGGNDASTARLELPVGVGSLPPGHSRVTGSKVSATPGALSHQGPHSGPALPAGGPEAAVQGGVHDQGPESRAQTWRRANPSGSHDSTE